MTRKPNLCFSTGIRQRRRTRTATSATRQRSRKNEKITGNNEGGGSDETSAENDKTPHTFLHSESHSAGQGCGGEKRKGGISAAQNVLQRMEWLTPFLEEEQKGSYRAGQDQKG